ncbi:MULTISPECIES: ATP synthase subunit I [Paenibacillus]|uniref:ATP synthase subunit I n=3 Tax=Paenibacillus TaxID=44249 RepID=A0AAJ2JZW7_9BACL|nr:MULTISPECIES: ATP synthase subunit I [Paenibacillus]EPY09555.1 ATP synthase I [Paenibacillus alvei A6-6i-x]MCY9528704.1 ATP synthase subunit I [Paenibacillus alvei]MDT8979878.1 ATP synthase subunit I [Paenibacillus sp. chi10]TQR43792.1 ATP synthase subunit I [Paenibacillus sp. SDF0028]SDG25307.1 ATP synthase protein I [Paenibacillus sp. cl6col]
MNDMASMVRAVTRVTLLLLSAFILGWAVAPEYRIYTAGLTLGTAAGLAYAHYLSIKVRQIAEMAASQEKRRYSFGFVTRMCIVLLAVMFAIKFEQHISLVATIVGFFITQLLSIFVSIIWASKKKV